MICPICTGSTFVHWTNCGDYAIVKCKECGLGITSPFPSKEELEESNKKIYDSQQRIQVYLSRQGYFEKRYKKYLSVIKEFTNGTTLLDIGCNIGLFVKTAQQEGFESAGIEVNTDCADYGRKKLGLKIYDGFVENQHFPDESFDVITLFDVLEHVPDVHSFLAEITRILKKGGVLTVQSPNINSVMAKLTKGKWNWLTPPDHLYHFTPETLTQLLISKQYSIKKIRTWEPLEDFINNYFPAVFGRAGNILVYINQKTKLFSLLFYPLQQVWWRKKGGALIELYAQKTKDLR